MRQTIRLTESDLHKLIKSCVDEALNEIGDTQRGQYALGCVAARNDLNMRKSYKNGDYASAQKYSNNSNMADKAASRSRAAANGGSEFNQENMANYYKAKYLFNAKEQGYRNYMSSQMHPYAEDYRTAKIKH